MKPDTTVYFGKRLGATSDVPISVTVNGETLDPAPSIRLRNHSPDGFNWGYNGSGPAQLALGLLLDFTEDEVTATKHYQAFKTALIQGFPNQWKLTGAQIKTWLLDNWVDNEQLRFMEAQEAHVTIEGVVLTFGQTMSLRVAVSNMLAELSEPEYMKALGKIGEGYQARLTEVQSMLIAKGK